jgi:WD40 repeat protein
VFLTLFQLKETVDAMEQRTFRAHKQPVTCMAVSTHDDFIFTGGKDGGIIKWSYVTGKKLTEFPGMRRKPGEGVPVTVCSLLFSFYIVPCHLQCEHAVC